MFQFTTTNVINSNQDYTTGKPLWTEGEDSLHIKRVNNFKKENVVAIYKAEAVEAENAKATIDLGTVGTVAEGDTLRLSIYVGLTQASQDSRYANDFSYKGKPISIDFVWKDSAAATVEALAKAINKYEVMVYGDKLLNVDYSGATLTLEATTEYQRFVKLNIEVLDEEKYHGMGDYKVVKSIEDLTEVDSSDAADSADTIFKGKEGFGTYSFLLHNLRLPTSMRTRAFGINQDETPIIGAKYNQYTLHYCAKRGILGLNAVGDVVKSLTTHVFYVKEDLAADFELALAKIAPEDGIEEVSTLSAKEPVKVAKVSTPKASTPKSE